MSWAADSATTNATQAEKLTVTVGKSVVIDSDSPVRRVSLAAPDIADALVLSLRQVYITGKSPGVTTLTLWSEPERVSRIFDVEVQPDIARLKTKLHELLPGEKDVRVTNANGGISLSGTVSSATNLSQVEAIAQAFAPVDKEGKNKVTNLLEVGGVQQVMLEVRVSEMSRSLIRRMGINFSVLSQSGKQFGLSLLDNLVALPGSGAFPDNPLSVTNNINGILRFLAGGSTWTVFIDALKDEGLLKVLAEPTLITLSGRQASFLAGGEYPIPVPQASYGAAIITIQYKPFGVALNFTPTVLSSGKISMLVAPEVSELDFSQAVAIQGYLVPSLTTRRVSTTVELADGQSFAIAGLLKDEVREDVRKFPILGDIPVLGALFRSTSFQRNETELIIIVTPHLVKPADMARQTLPTDAFVAPNDFEWYLLGTLEGTDRAANSAPSLSNPPAASMRRGGLEGDFGHIMP
ncbi:MAG TPA: type II and III secretion system protein family protein [Syntrophorhabdales bacterium]|nr:type II and III secretion system protein family protein [Syntrophorhabdales bacterium]